MLTREGKRYIRRSLHYRLHLLGWRLAVAGLALGIPLFVLIESAPQTVARVCAILAIAAFVLTACAVIFTMATAVALARPIREAGGLVSGHTIAGMLLVDLLRAPLSPRRHRDDRAAPAQSDASDPK